VITTRKVDSLVMLLVDKKMEKYSFGNNKN